MLVVVRLVKLYVCWDLDSSGCDSQLVEYFIVLSKMFIYIGVLLQY